MRTKTYATETYLWAPLARWGRAPSPSQATDPRLRYATGGATQVACVTEAFYQFNATSDMIISVRVDTRTQIVGTRSYSERR